jgi:phospholipase/carboxylesterase
MEIKISTRKIDDWVVRLREPPGDGLFPVFLLLHGWTGDEKSMWAFATRFPTNAVLLAPRGLFSTPLGGFGWHPFDIKSSPWIDDFQDSVYAILELLNRKNFPKADFTRLHLVGFSQGAAMAYSIALMFPEKLNSIAGLSGFLPEGSSPFVRDKPLAGKHVFIAHGIRDELVPVEKARYAVNLLSQAGADVSYCEDDVGHKLSLTCFRSLENFLAQAG